MPIWFEALDQIFPIYYLHLEGKVVHAEYPTLLAQLQEHWQNSKHSANARRRVMIVDTTAMEGLPPYDFKIFRNLVTAPASIQTDLVFVNAPEVWVYLCNVVKNVFKIDIVFCRSRVDAIKAAQRLANIAQSISCVHLN